MRTNTGQIQMDGNPPLATILSEIAERLCNDDWERRSTAGHELTYYIVGFQAHRLDVDGVVDFESEFPLPSSTSPLTQWFTKAQIAGQQVDYVQAARRRLTSLGVSDDELEAFLELHWDKLKRLKLREHPEMLAAFADLLEASMVARVGAPENLGSDERQRISRDRAKVYLRELAKKYSDLLARIPTLDALEFADPQLEEASRCYLYGHNRAAIVLAAASVETHLKRVTGKDWFAKYQELVDTAFWAGQLDGGSREAATRVFSIRRQVIHDALNPSVAETASTLDLARGVVESLHG